jgi:outer membrane protein
MKKWSPLLAFMLYLFLYQVGWAEEWDLKTCVAMGLQKNPNIHGAVKGIEAAQSRVKESQAAYYPNIFAQADANHLSAASSVNNIRNLNQGPNDLTIYSVGLSQNIYDFGRTKYNVQTSKEDLKTFQWTLKDTRLSVIDNIRQAYYGVLLTQRVVRVRQEALADTQEHLKQAQGFYQVGLKAKIDVTQAEVAVITAQSALLQAENDVRVAWVTLASAMGLDSPPGVTLKDDLETSRVNWKLEDLRKEAVERDPVLNRLRATIAFWEAQIQEAKSGFWPTLAGTASYGYNNGTNYNYDETWFVGVTLNIPIFSGFLNRAKVAENQASLSQAKSNEESQKLVVLGNIQTLYLNQVLAEKQIDVTNEALRSAKENLDLANGRYKAGIGAMLDITDARSSYVQSETNYIQSLYNYITALYKVERALGRE